MHGQGRLGCQPVVRYNPMKIRRLFKYSQKKNSKVERKKIRWIIIVQQPFTVTKFVTQFCAVSSFLCWSLWINAQQASQLTTSTKTYWHGQITQPIYQMVDQYEGVRPVWYSLLAVSALLTQNILQSESPRQNSGPVPAISFFLARTQKRKACRVLASRDCRVQFPHSFPLKKDHYDSRAEDPRL